MDAANGGHDDSTSDTPMVDGTAEASSVGAGAVTEGDVIGVTETLQLTNLHAMDPVITQLDGTSSQDTKRPRARSRQLSLHNSTGMPLAEPIFALSEVPLYYPREASEAGSGEESDEEEAWQGCGPVMAYLSSLLFYSFLSSSLSYSMISCMFR